jgi:polyphenol oxidase
MIKSAELERSERVRHAFFTREGGVSQGIFAALNCGQGSGDDPALVRRNRAIAMQTLAAAPEALVTAYQVHSRDALLVREPWAPDARPKVDALVTDRPGVVLGILTADCAPLLFADAAAGVIGAAHAGWRGALLGVAESAIEIMCERGAVASRIVAAIGPCIGPDSYEVGPEFPAPFLAADAKSARFFKAAKRPRHFYFDLPGYIAARLAKLGLHSVEAARADTLADEERFFSYRRATLRGEKDYGRLLSAICLTG